MSLPGAHLIDKNPPHYQGRNGEEMRWRLTVWKIGGDDPQVRFLYQRLRLHGGMRSFTLNETIRQSSQLAMDEGSQLSFGQAITALQLNEETHYLRSAIAHICFPNTRR